MSEEMIEVYDSETHQLCTIPAKEFVPGMGAHRVFTVPIEELTKGDYRHPPLPESAKSVCRQIADCLHEVAPGTTEEWEDDFRRDLHPEREMLFWCRVCRVYEHFTKGRGLELGQKKDIYRAVFTIAYGEPAKGLRCRTLSPKRVREIERAWQVVCSETADFMEN
jgi:hypothetical protein